MSITALIAIAACISAGTALAVAVNLYLEKSDGKRRQAELLGRTTADSGTAPSKQAEELKREPVAVKPFARLLKLSNPRTASQQKLLYDSELAQLLEVAALGMRAGMAFDQSFELALRRFPGELAGLCSSKLDIWQKGLISREQGLRELEASIDTILFSRFASLVLRAIRYGAPMTQLLCALAEEAHRDIRSRREEEVAKAPVKMLIPTGVLILPAMLLLVLGPIILDLIANM